MITDRMFTVMHGGLGDIINHILERGADFGYFASLPPETRKAVGIWCVTDTAAELLVAHPLVNEFAFEPFNPDDRERRTAERLKGYTRLDAADKAKLEWRQPTFVLNEEEKQIAAEVIARGPFIAYHPFAGDPSREFSVANGLRPEYSAEVMCKAGARVVLLGGDSNRWLGNKLSTRRDALGEFTHDNFTDLRNRGTVRLHTHLVGHANAFVGTVSAFNCAAHQYGKPALCFTAAFNRRYIETHTNGIFWHMRTGGRTQTYYFDRMPRDAYDIVARFAGEHK